MADSDAIARLERSVEKVSDNIDRMKEDNARANNETKDLLHAIQRKTDQLESQLAQNSVTTAETRAIVSRVDGDVIDLKERVLKLDSIVFDQGGLKDQSKQNCEQIKDVRDLIIPDGINKVTALSGRISELELNKRDGLTIWKVVGWCIGAVITASVFFTAISYFMQKTISSPPSPLAVENNSSLKRVERALGVE